MKALVGAFNQEKALVGAFSVLVKTGWGTDGSICGTSLIAAHVVTCAHAQVIESSLKFGRQLDSDHIPLQHFFIVLEHVLRHGVRPKKVFRNISLTHFWLRKQPK